MGVHEELRRAVEARRLIRYEAAGSEFRVAEPHVFGRQGTVPCLLVYHVDGMPEPERWRLLEMPDILVVDVLGETFARRPLPQEYARTCR